MRGIISYRQSLGRVFSASRPADKSHWAPLMRGIYWRRGGYWMLRLDDHGVRLCDGLSRRALLRAGGIGGLSLAALSSGRRAVARTTAEVQGEPRPKSFGRAKSVIMYFLLGGPSQHDTWDPKPEA